VLLLEGANKKAAQTRPQTLIGKPEVLVLHKKGNEYLLLKKKRSSEKKKKSKGSADLGSTLGGWVRSVSGRKAKQGGKNAIGGSKNLVSTSYPGVHDLVNLNRAEFGKKRSEKEVGAQNKKRHRGTCTAVFSNWEKAEA